MSEQDAGVRLQRVGQGLYNVFLTHRLSHKTHTPAV